MTISEWIVPAILIVVAVIILIVKHWLENKPKPKNYYRYR